MKVRPFMVVVMDAQGVTHDYVFKARRRRHAEREARECVAQSEWATTLVGITPIVDDNTRARRRRLLALGAFTLAFSGITITSMMIIGLSLEGAI
jgi:hypothetical protein